MDLSKMTNERKLHLCKWYFRSGFALLPFVWAVNTVWFFRTAFLAPPFPEQKQIKKYVTLSAIGAGIWGTLLVAWVITFQLKRASWDEFGDFLSYIIPEGKA